MVSQSPETKIPLAKRLHDWGVRRVLFSFVLRMLQHLIGLRISRMWVGNGRLDTDPPPFETPQGYDVRVVGKQDLAPFANDTYSLNQDFLDTAFANGDIATAAFFDGDLVGYTFNTTARTVVTSQLDLLVPEGFRYSYKGWTHPNHRRKNVSRMLWDPTQQYYRNHHLSLRSAWYIQINNYPSRLNTYRHPNIMGIRTGFVGWIRLFGREIPFTTRWARKMGLILVRRGDQRPTLYTE